MQYVIYVALERNIVRWVYSLSKVETLGFCYCKSRYMSERIIDHFSRNTIPIYVACGVIHSTRLTIYWSTLLPFKCARYYLSGVRFHYYLDTWMPAIKTFQISASHLSKSHYSRNSAVRYSLRFFMDLILSIHRNFFLFAVDCYLLLNFTDKNFELWHLKLQHFKLYHFKLRHFKL